MLTAKCTSYGVEIPRLRSGFRRAAQTPRKRLNLSVILPRGFHPFPSRTRKLSPAGPMVLHAKVCGSVGRRRHKIKATLRKQRGLFLFVESFDPARRTLVAQIHAAKQAVEARVRAEAINPQISFDVPRHFQRPFAVSSF